MGALFQHPGGSLLLHEEKKNNQTCGKTTSCFACKICLLFMNQNGILQGSEWTFRMRSRLSADSGSLRWNEEGNQRNSQRRAGEGSTKNNDGPHAQQRVGWGCGLFTYHKLHTYNLLLYGLKTEPRFISEEAYIWNKRDHFRNYSCTDRQRFLIYWQLVKQIQNKESSRET